MKRARPRPGGGDTGAGCTVTVCRGCCCGTTARHPGIDHAGQVARLRTALAGVAQVRVSDCLDVCEHSNVVVINPSRAGRHAGARPVWLGFVLDDGAVDDITAWVGAGGPGVADPPVTVDLYAFKPPRRVVRAVER